jgi:hypothetical protein
MKCALSLFAFALCSWMTGCVDDPSTANPISVTPSATSLPADGVSTISLVVAADTDGQVTLSASSGAFINAPAPARGSTTVTYLAALTPGTAVITASAGAYSLPTNITLTESAPAQIVLMPDRTTVTGDGVSFVELQTSVFAAQPPALVSVGATLEYGVCCGTPGALMDCSAGAAPLAIPDFAQLTTGQEVVVRAIAQKVTDETPAVLLARVHDTRFTESICATAQTSEVRSNAIVISVAP